MVRNQKIGRTVGVFGLLAIFLGQADASKRAQPDDKTTRENPDVLSSSSSFLSGVL